MSRTSIAVVTARHPALSAFTVAYLVAGLIWGLTTASPLTFPYLAIVVALIAVAVHLEARVGLGTGLLAALSLWGLAHFAGGLLTLGGDSLYFCWVIPDVVRYDQVVHVYGTACATVVAGRMLCRWLAAQQLGAGPALLLVLVGTGVGGVGEIIEFITTRVAPGTNVGDYANNGWDLVSDFVGAVAATAWVYRRPRPPPRTH